jgi:hypothetical protein
MLIVTSTNARSESLHAQYAEGCSAAVALQAAAAPRNSQQCEFFIELPRVGSIEGVSQG